MTRPGPPKPSRAGRETARSRRRRLPITLIATTALAVWCPAPVAAHASGEGALIVSVSCAPRSSFCVAVDLGGRAFELHGTTWTTARSPVDRRGLTQVSCTSASFCMGVDGRGRALILNGSSWRTSMLPGAFPATLVSCVTARFCVAADAFGAARTYNGRSWSKSRRLGPVTGSDSGPAVQGVSCATTSFCGAVDSSGDAATFNGRSWSGGFVDSNADFSLSSISCPSAGWCMAVDGYGDALSYRSGQWSGLEPVEPDSRLASVSCVSSAFCLAADEDQGDVLAFDGAGWGPPTTIADVFAVSCASPRLCVAGTSAGTVALFDGTSWSVPAALAPSSASGRRGTARGPGSGASRA
ncbi:MAG TPA: hypothetical protein VHX88_09190 [Solirubrobacteraceae bacterium]|nr:hypothetical protein [Solirubrobacteraceae bacterium]